MPSGGRQRQPAEDEPGSRAGRGRTQLGLQQHRHLRSRSDVGSRTKNRPPLAASLCTTHHDQPALPATAAGGLIATCCVDLAGYDLTRLGELMPHPVYAWRRWVQVLSPSRPQYQSLKPLLAASLEVVKAKGAKTKRTPS